MTPKLPLSFSFSDKIMHYRPLPYVINRARLWPSEALSYVIYQVQEAPKSCKSKYSTALSFWWGGNQIPIKMKFTHQQSSDIFNAFKYLACV